MSSTTESPSVNVETTNDVDTTSGSTPTNSNTSESTTKEEKPQVNLLNVPIKDEHAALNVIVGFLGIAQRRGAFAINESAKIFECVKMFQTNNSE